MLYNNTLNFAYFIVQIKNMEVFYEKVKLFAQTIGNNYVGSNAANNV